MSIKTMWQKRRFQLAFFYAVPISLLVGLMGLGGAEFRLPVLAGLLGYSARQAVPLNLAVSLVTIIGAITLRYRNFHPHEVKTITKGTDI